MKATIKNPALLKDVLKLISSFTKEVRLEFTPTSLRINAVEVAQIAHVLYEHRSCEADGTFSADIFLEHFIQALKPATKDQDVTVTITENELLVVEYEKPRSSKYTLPLLAEFKHDGREPKLTNFQAVTVVSAKQLKEVFGAAEDIGSEVLLSSRDGKLVLSARADVGIRSCEITVDAKEHNAKQECSSLYSLKYLLDFADATRLYDDAVVQLGDGYPLQISFSDKDSYLRFILADRNITR